jgi:hypothetical protein
MAYNQSVSDINVPTTETATEGTPSADVYIRTRGKRPHRGVSPVSAVRIALAVVLAAALLGVALPAVDAGRGERTATAVESSAERIARTAAHLRAVEDPTPPDVPGARAVVTVDVPAQSWDAAGVAYVAVGGSPGAPGDRGVVAYRVRGRQSRTVPLDVAVRTPDGPVAFRTAGEHRVALSLVRDDGVAVVVSRGGD